MISLPRNLYISGRRTASEVLRKQRQVFRPVLSNPSLLREMSTLSNLQQTVFIPVNPDVEIPKKKMIFAHPMVLSNAQDTLTIQQGEDKVEIPLLWLRDSCECKICQNSKTRQRTSWTIPMDVKLNDAEISDGVLLRAVWSDGHQSQHKLEDVRKKFYVEKDSPLVRRHTWTRQTWRGIPLPVIPQSEVLTDSGLKALLSNIHRFGFGLVNGCGVSEAETETLIRRIAPPKPTTFSPTMWTFTSNGERGDTAYSNEYLAPHTDTTYFSNPCRIQVFHCLDRTGCTGGETILVDGFKCAEELKRVNPEAMETLSTIAQETVYVEPNISYKWTDTVFSHSKKDNSLLGVRFNMYDRSTLPPVCPTKDVNTFYASLKQYADLTQKRDNQLLLMLTPGVVIFIDNWRVLHGRSEFIGKRVLTGCYMDNDEFNHACRKFKVIS